MSYIGFNNLYYKCILFLFYRNNKILKMHLIITLYQRVLNTFLTVMILHQMPLEGAIRNVSSVTYDTIKNIPNF